VVLGRRTLALAAALPFFGAMRFFLEMGAARGTKIYKGKTHRAKRPRARSRTDRVRCYRICYRTGWEEARSKRKENDGTPKKCL
jgi:hypothetical protein